MPAFPRALCEELKSKLCEQITGALEILAGWLTFKNLDVPTTFLLRLGKGAEEQLSFIGVLPP